MAGLFSKKKPADKTILVVDIENASVGCALVRVSPGSAPKLFAESRTALPVFDTLDTSGLLREVDKALRAALLHASTTAARMRGHTRLETLGNISSVAVFAAAPWAQAVPWGNAMRFEFEPALQATAKSAIEDAFGLLPVTFHSLASASTHAANTLFEEADGLLLCILTGEVTELALVEGGIITGQSTIPTGKHLLTRTLATHAGLSKEEAQSLLVLARQAEQLHVHEPLSAAGKHFAHHFNDAAQQIKRDTPIRGILVIAGEPTGEWAARSLASHESLTNLFDEGTAVQALHVKHLMPHLAAHAAKPDLVFMIEAVFIDHAFTGI